MRLKDVGKGDADWVRESVLTKEDLIVLVQDKYRALKFALAAGLCEWRTACPNPMCLCENGLRLVERSGSDNLWWRCRIRSCRTYVSTFDRSIFPGCASSWKNVLIAVWETSYDARVTSIHIARVCCVQYFLCWCCFLGILGVSMGCAFCISYTRGVSGVQIGRQDTGLGQGGVIKSCLFG